MAEQKKTVAEILRGIRRATRKKYTANEKDCYTQYKRNKKNP